MNSYADYYFRMLSSNSFLGTLNSAQKAELDKINTKVIKSQVPAKELNPDYILSISVPSEQDNELPGGLIYTSKGAMVK